jgi:hypothetical protein
MAGRMRGGLLTIHYQLFGDHRLNSHQKVIAKVTVSQIVLTVV